MTSYNPNYDFNGHFKAFITTIGVIIGILIISLFFSGCSPEKRMTKLLKKHSELLQTKTKDSLVVKEHLVRHDTTITLPGKETTFWDTLPCPQANYIHSVKKNGLTASVSVVRGILHVDCKADSINALLQYSYWVNDTLNYYITTHTVTVAAKPIKDWWYWLKEFITIAVLAYFVFKYGGPLISKLLDKTTIAGWLKGLPFR